MSRLLDLKAAHSLHSFAPILGYTAKGLAYIIYGIPDTKKYNDFQIPKRSGGMRTISAPVPELKLLQQHLANLLEACIVEVDKERGVKNTLSHGFRPKHSIMTNAAVHRGRRYVFNVDLHNFFGSINFGRVWGYFEKQRDFLLSPVIARTIAQIACHNRVLPQGSPCSPVLSNLIAHILDMRMAQLAAKTGCRYSRYADDLTFSSNRHDFPAAIAKRIDDTNLWEPSPKLLKEVRRCGFMLNPSKTRMQHKHFRQDVTGIIVNKKLNVPKEYYKKSRAMVHSLISKGTFEVRRSVRNEQGGWEILVDSNNEDQLQGILSFIESVRHFERKRNPPKKARVAHRRMQHRGLKDLDAHARTYRRFLLFTQFFRPSKPLLVCEGKTDNIYIQCALKQLAEKFPLLAEKKDGKVYFHLNFFHYTKTADRILHLSGGTGDMKKFISTYGSEFSMFHHEGSRNPVIILIDNDDGARDIFATIKKATKSNRIIDGTEPYYFIRDNLYVVPLPKLQGKATAIEDFFDGAVLATQLNNKSFSRTDTFDPSTQYGKRLFAEYVIKTGQDTIDFSAFEDVLEAISYVIRTHPR